MGVVLHNEEYVGGIDKVLAAKIGIESLQTEAQDLSGAVNELIGKTVTEGERTSWNSKISCYIDPNDPENLVFVSKVLQSIEATFTQGSAKITSKDSLDTLKQYLTVTGSYTDGSTSTIVDYMLVGTLTAGTSTITVVCGNCTDTFDVTVSSPYLYDWDFTKSLIDSVQGVTVSLYAATGYDPPAQSLDGITFTQPTQYIAFGNGYNVQNKTIEYDVSYVNFKGNTGYHMRQLMLGNADYRAKGMSPFMWRHGEGWAMYGWDSSTGDTAAWSGTWEGLSGSSTEILNICSGKTVKIVISDTGDSTSLYLDDVLIETKTGIVWRNGSDNGSITFGGVYPTSASAGDQCYDMILTGLRIYENS